MKTFKAGGAVCLLALCGAVFAPSAKADDLDKKTVITFSGPVEIPGVHLTGWAVLPAGTYVFRLLDSQSDRHIVQILSKDEKTVYATILAIPNYRLKATGKTVITFSERPAGEPEALRAWFYPGRNYGDEFVYPKEKAVVLSRTTKSTVLFAQTDLPVEVAGSITSADEPVVVELKRAPLMAIRPAGDEVLLAEVVTPPPPSELQATQLPGTASSLPLLALLGMLALCGALGLRLFEKRFQKVLGYILSAALLVGLAPLGLRAQSVRAPVNLGTAGNFVVLSETGITDVPPAQIVGNIGASPITGAAIHVSCPEVVGTIYQVDAAGPACFHTDSALLGQAVLDMGTAYTAAAGVVIPPPDAVNLGAGDVSGLTIQPGLYKWSTSVQVTSFVNLSGGPNAVWIFQIAGDLLLANNAQIRLSGGAQANNIFWQVGGPTAVTIGTGAVFNGTILTTKQVIINSGATLNGRALAQTQVTLQGNPINTPGPLSGGIPIPVAPTVSSTVPANGSVNVAINSALSATFSEAMNPATINVLTFTVKNGLAPIAGTVSYAGVTATFTPTLPLPAGTTLTGTITTGAQDPSGAALAGNFVWTFTTAAALDLTPPTVSSTIPALGAVGVPVDNALSATFSEAMNPLTITNATFTLTQNGVAVAGTVSYAGVTATFTPTSNLAANLPFVATITTGVTDLAGNHMVANYPWTFTTGAAHDITPPTVTFVVPANGSAGVPVGNALSATFSEAMNPLTITNLTFTLTQNGVTVPGTVSYAGLTATFTPLANLAANLPFVATITTGVTDLAGNHMVANYPWTFTTGAIVDVTPPTVSSTVPANNAVAVPVGNALSATFSEAMNPLTITNVTFTLKQGATAVPGTVTYAGVTATFTPTVSLAANLPFTATISTGVTDLAGNHLASAYLWSFTTGASPDVTPPTVTFTIPVAGATNVPVGNALAAAFSEALNPLTVNNLTFILKQGALPVAGTVTYAGVTATFKPLAALAPNTLFTATITTGVTDLAGNALASNFVWTFTTGATPDTTAPLVTSTYPVNGATGVPQGIALIATFDHAMDPLTLNTSTFTVRVAGVLIPGTVALSGQTAIFTPLVALPANTLVNATISSLASDLAGNYLASNYLWSFTTGNTVDITPPTVISTAPANGATLITSTTNLGAAFSEIMNPLSITNATFMLMQGTTQIPGTVTYAGTSASFRPLVNLLPNTVYSAVITTGVTDLAGNRLQANYVWSFTTGNSFGQTPVCLSSFALLGGAGVISTGSSAVKGDIGVGPGASITGFPPGTLNGASHLGDAAAVQGIAAFTAAYADAVSRAGGAVSVSGDLGGQTLTPGLYNSATSLQIVSGNLTLDGKGNPNAVFVFQIGGTLNTAAGNQILLAGGAQSFNVFFQVATSATLGATSVFNGSILANQSITLNTAAAVNGRLEALNGTITLQSNTITSPPPSIAPGGILNAADELQSVAAGSIATIFGNNLSSSFYPATSYPLPLSLGGTSFQIGSQGAPLYMSSCSQVNLQIPWESAGLTTPPVTATSEGLVSASQPLTLAPFAPGIFSLSMVGSGQGAVQIAPTAQLAGPAGPNSAPVAQGAYVAIFCTGLGPVSNQPATGAAALSSPLSVTLATPTVTIGGQPAQVTFSGLAPGFAGLYQVNAIVPSGIASGSAVNLAISIGGISSNTVTIAVQ